MQVSNGGIASIMTSSRYTTSKMRLYSPQNERLYLNSTERFAFQKAAERLAPEMMSFCLTLLHTGCRISEALEARAGSVDLGAGVMIIRTLKRRSDQVMREVPIPISLMETLKETQGIPSLNNAALLWERNGAAVNRSTAYRWIKHAMTTAGIKGPQASPKGLRHAYGVHAIRSGVPLPMLQKWMGHASMETTAIYTNAIGADERYIAEWMWSKTAPFHK